MSNLRITGTAGAGAMLFDRNGRLIKTLSVGLLFHRPERSLIIRERFGDAFEAHPKLEFGSFDVVHLNDREDGELNITLTLRPGRSAFVKTEERFRVQASNFLRLLKVDEYQVRKVQICVPQLPMITYYDGAVVRYVLGLGKDIIVHRVKITIAVSLSRLTLFLGT